MIITPHPGLHPLFEALAYIVGFAVYKVMRQDRGDALNDIQRSTIILAAAIGALLGSRFLGLVEQLPTHALTWQYVIQPGGKTIVGGLLGGWIAVEIAKSLNGIHSRTGDLFAVPLCIGIAVGRVGCFISGLADDTYGTATTLPWGVDFGDGIRRHPVQIYEIIFLTALAITLAFRQSRPHRNGSIFRAFLAAYLTFRLLIDFIKPQPHIYGLNAIQWACVVALLWLAFDFARDRNPTSVPVGS